MIVSNRKQVSDRFASAGGIAVKKHLRSDGTIRSEVFLDKKQIRRNGGMESIKKKCFKKFHMEIFETLLEHKGIYRKYVCEQTIRI